MNQKSWPQQHHYVPEMLSKRFVDKNGKLHFFIKRFSENGVITIAPNKAFKARHLYSAIRADGTKDVSLEVAYSKLEGKADYVIEKLITQARQGHSPSLSIDEKRTFDEFFYDQWRRVPDFHEPLFEAQNFAPILEEARTDFESKYGALSPELKSLFCSPEYLEEYRQNVKVGVLTQKGKRVLDFLEVKFLGVARIQRPDRAFILGSLPVVENSYSDRICMFNTQSEQWLLIAPDVAVRYTPLQKHVAILNADVRRINMKSYLQSSAIAGHSRALVERFARIH